MLKFQTKSISQRCFFSSPPNALPYGLYECEEELLHINRILNPSHIIDVYGFFFRKIVFGRMRRETENWTSDLYRNRMAQEQWSISTCDRNLFSFLKLSLIFLWFHSYHLNVLEFFHEPMRSVENENYREDWRWTPKQFIVRWSRSITKRRLEKPSSDWRIYEIYFHSSDDDSASLPSWLLL